MILPGKYLLEVSKNNYETVRKFINLEKGYNNFNIEMFTEKICNLKISVFNYEKSLSMIASGEISNDIIEENNNLSIESNNVDNDNFENEFQSNDFYDHFYDE